PALPAAGLESRGLTSQFKALRHHQVWMSYLTVMVVMVGALVFGTYQVPMMIEITGIDPEIVPIYLLLGGVGSVLGIYVGGEATNWKPMPFLVAVLLLQSVFYFTMAAFSLYDPV